MADELEIDIELSNELIDEMNKQCNAVVNNINTIKTTTAWTWAHCQPEEKEGLRQYILATITPPMESLADFCRLNATDWVKVTKNLILEISYNHGNRYST